MSKEIQTMPHPTLPGVEVELRFRNHYECPRCEHKWEEEWDSMCDSECPECDLRDISPDYSDDLVEEGDEYDGIYENDYATDGEEHF